MSPPQPLVGESYTPSPLNIEFLTSDKTIHTAERDVIPLRCTINEPKPCRIYVEGFFVSFCHLFNREMHTCIFSGAGSIIVQVRDYEKTFCFYFISL